MKMRKLLFYFFIYSAVIFFCGLESSFLLSAKDSKCSEQIPAALKSTPHDNNTSNSAAYTISGHEYLDFLNPVKRQSNLRTMRKTLCWIHTFLYRHKAFFQRDSFPPDSQSSSIAQSCLFDFHLRI